jgi:hypothetical protein
VDGTDDDTLWNDSEESGNVRSECVRMRELNGKERRNLMSMKLMTVKMDMLTLICKGRKNLKCFVYSVYEMNSNIFFLADILFLGDVLDLDKYILLWQTCFLGGHFRLE